MDRLFLEIITPDTILVNQEVDMVIGPGALGEFGILPGHALFLTGIEPGELRYQVDGKNFSLAVMKGFAEVSHNRVSMVVDAAETAEVINTERANNALERAQQRLVQKRKTGDIDFLRAEAALKRAIIRLKIAQKTK